jgi:3-oxoacyl-[acyl-carrier protein] reductase
MSGINISLEGHTAIVTGATGELGRTMAYTLACAGADIVIHYHKNRTQAKILSGKIEKLGCRTMICSADIGEELSVKKLKQQTEEAGFIPDIIVNNAVVQYEWKDILKQPVKDYESQFKSCVLQNVLMAQAFVPGMKSRKWGRVIGINTECAIQCFKTQSAYAAAKRGMDGVLRVLAREVAEDGITVNQVAPGWTVSENKPSTGSDREYTEKVPFKRRGTDQEIANAVLFLASDLAAYITGVYLPVCGGNVMPSI